ncbi:DNA helicase PIF1, ATP-dependent [Artemisia annua]|uniref:DNA helicase PIF1, ATP-dependent n=1 Tax=Artemisia annua TaxID=35608 RepID=A0A2U1MV48_ARTAN|nr:DNA helicase PIF1, ATP-dependent [Artemisia annua]
MGFRFLYVVKVLVVEARLEGCHQSALVDGPDMSASFCESSVVGLPMIHASAASVPVQVTTVDGLVSTFRVSDGQQNALHIAQSLGGSQGSAAGQPSFHIGEGSSNTPRILDFSGRVSVYSRCFFLRSRFLPTQVYLKLLLLRDGVADHAQLICQTEGDHNVQVLSISVSHDFNVLMLFSAAALPVTNRSHTHAGQSRSAGANRSPTYPPAHSLPYQGQTRDAHTTNPLVQGPIAPPQRQRAPAEYKYFGRCDQICQHCSAQFWWAERRTGLPASVAPQYQRCCAAGRAYMYIYDRDHEVHNRLSHFDPHERQILREDIVEGLIQFLDENNALVRLFRTARDKLLEADIPNFNIRLFGVVGANQYELPTADNIGAIVYEGGPETMTDYDVVIERHSREPESINKLHPQYMALQFPLLFIYGEEGYHLNLRLRNFDLSDTQDEKKMTMKIYYALMALTGETSALSKTAPELLIPQRSFAYFTDLNPADNTKYIEARVYRKWTSMKMPSLIATGFSCILLDKKGSAIQANADLNEKDRFDHDLQLDNVYRIQGFGFERTDNWGKTLDNDFTLYYIGYIHNVEKVQEYGSAAGNKIRVRNIALCNLKNNVVLFTLWNDKADGFEEEEYNKMPKPVVLAVSSCYLKTYGGQLQLSATSATSYYFNPPVKETTELLTAYNVGNMQAPQIEVHSERSAEWEQERTRNRVPLATLLQIDPNTQQRVLFTQDVFILQVDSAYDWYYRKCEECGGKLDYGYIHGHCHPFGTESKPQNRVTITDGTANAIMACFSPQTDGLIKDINTLLEEVADKDPTIIPPQILALQNTKHVLQFKFAKPTGKGTPTFILQKVMDYPPTILAAPATTPSSPPTVSPAAITYTQITPPPTTPTAAEETPAETSTTPNEPIPSAVRKQLFTDAPDEDIDSQLKKQKTE